jgi:hypothetical protein
MNFSKLMFHRLREYLPLIIGLFFLAPLFFFQAFRYSFPMGYAGMFAQMAEQIAAANFVLPMEIPYYGPGGIPFVYPPLAHYLFAFALKFGFPLWAYLRLAPAFFTLLAFVAFYFFAKELTGSKVVALVATCLAACAPPVFYTHIWAAGVVRGVALGLCFAGLLFYLRAMRQFSWGVFVLAGISLGLLLMTHLLYVLFAALIGAALLFSEFNWRRFWFSAGILLLAFLVATPWLGIIFSRHGLESFLAASSSHRNLDFFAMLLQDTASAWMFLSENLTSLVGNWFLLALSLLGLALLLAKKKFQLPLMILLVLLMGEASIFLPLLTSLLAAVFVDWALKVFFLAQGKLTSLRLAFAAFSFLSITIIIFALIDSVKNIVIFEPEIDAHSIVMAQFVRAHTDGAQTYLYIGRINEAEWFPYLLERAPIFALWGSEWKGIYAEQLQVLIDLRACQNEKSWYCIQNLLTQHETDPDLLIGPNRSWLETQIKDTRAWNLIYSNERYLVWERLR